MLSYTFKSIIMGFCRNGFNDKFIITALGEQTGILYKFSTYKGIVSVEMSTNGADVGIPNLKDLELFKLKDRTVNVKTLEKESYKPDGSVYEYFKVNLDYPVRLFIELFRLLKMRACFTIKYEDRYIDCYYISDKVRWREETASYCNLHCADLYKLNTIFPGYEVVLIGSPLHRNSFKDYITREEAIAEKVGKGIRKYYDGVIQ